jgi:hypothetical protein
LASVDRQTPAERAAQANAMSVALAQPHRQGSPDPARESALGRFCRRMALGGHCYGAGIDYRNIVLESLRTRGFKVHGWAPGNRWVVGLSDAQIMAQATLARKREDNANALLRRIDTRLPGWMRDLCYEERDCEPSAGAAPTLKAGLALLADAWGLAPRRAWDA